MSRLTVRKAIQEARSGRWEEAVALLRTMEASSAQPHLRKLIERGDPQAAQLWTQLYPNDPLPAATPPPPADTEPVAPVQVPPRMVLLNPAPPLAVMSAAPGRVLELGNSFIAQAWALTGIGALGREGSREHCEVVLDDQSNGVRFARALGLEDVFAGRASSDPGEKGRTVKLRRLPPGQPVEPVAHDIAELIAPQDPAAQQTLVYVVVELLRNVVQHSGDPFGGVVAAQSMTADQQYDRPAIQVAVADNGMGILAHLRGTHPDLTDAGAAIEKALRAHVSGAFPEWQTGGTYNAGFGLFAIAELTKLTGGRLLVASRGAALSIQGNRADTAKHTASLVAPAGTGYPGTLVAFELPLGDVPDFAYLMEEVRQRAEKQTPVRAVHRWITYDAPPAGAQRILVHVVREDTEKAALVSNRIRNCILAGDPIVLDFAGMTFVTQSFLHALLFRPLRLAWAERQPVHAVNVTPAVRSALETLEQYALGG